MGDLRSVSKEFITEFIKMYRNLPCLWKIKSKEYGDRVLKRLAYEVLAEKLSEVIPWCNKETVVKKIDSLRGNFRKEYRKVKNAEKSGLKYVPSLWYYQKLIFLKNQNLEIVPTIQVFEITQQEEDEQKEEKCFPEFNIKSEVVEYEPIDSIVNLFKEPTSNQSTLPSTNPSASTVFTTIGSSARDRPRRNPGQGLSTFDVKAVATTTTTTRSTEQKRRYKKQDASEYDAEDAVFSPHAQERRVDNDKRYERPAGEDEFDVVGKHFAYKLRALPKSVRIVTEKLMSDILFEAELGNINRNTTINNII